jgi:hypothetical protein
MRPAARYEHQSWDGLAAPFWRTFRRLGTATYDSGWTGCPVGQVGERSVRILRIATLTLAAGSFAAFSAGVAPDAAWSASPSGRGSSQSPLQLTLAAQNTKSICTGSRLARAAHSWALSQHGLAGTSELTNFYCRGSYALSGASTTNGGGYGFLITFRMVSTSSWKVLASSNLVPPNGLPRSVYKGFVALPPKDFHDGAFHF